MQQAGMAIGGHTDAHRALATMGEAEMAEDLSRCRVLLDRRLQPQTLWPFSYPYGKNSSYTPAATARLRDLRFDCAFSTEAGPNGAGSDLYGLRRVDCKRAPV
jgi:peptidoglycan/xylan/chitin deacetylase (PgdA/CDA1 family)